MVYYRSKEWVDLRALSQVMAAPPELPHVQTTSASEAEAKLILSTITPR